MLHTLIELLAGFVALMAAAALSPFGVDLNLPSRDREVRKVDCAETRPQGAIFTSEPRRDC